MNLSITINTDYMAIDNHIVLVTINMIIVEQQTIICDIYNDNGNLVCSGACYWYAGENKNIPFEINLDKIINNNLN